MTVLRSPLARTLLRIVSTVALGLLVLLAVGLLLLVAFGGGEWRPGQADYTLYRGATLRWLDGGSFYGAAQLAGPYTINHSNVSAVLYPPVVLWLLVPFAYLPRLLWWGIPMSLTAFGLWRLRPSRWTWPVMLTLAILPSTPNLYVQGNPGMWTLAAFTLGLSYPGAAVFVLVKPTLAPFAMAGLTSRSWWVALAIFGLACVPFGAMWVDWWRAAVANPTNGGLLYSLGSVPGMCLPLVAWAGRAHSALRHDGAVRLDNALHR